MIVAKPIRDKKFWILQQGNEKIGNVEATEGGYQVCINSTVKPFKTLRMLKQHTGIHFEDAVKQSAVKSTFSVHGYPTDVRAHNAVYDLNHKLPLFTKTRKSKSWYAAGYYMIKKNRVWHLTKDPKLITLKRYEYRGPFATAEEAQQ
jgi:hypothetical protein